MTGVLRRIAFWGAVQGAVVYGATVVSAGDVRQEVLRAFPVAAHPGRIIVKYRPQVSACAHCLLAKGIPFATVTGSTSLDHLNRSLGVRGARALFFEQHGLASDRTAAFRDTLDAVRARFPVRSARISPKTIAPDLSNVYVLDLPRATDVVAAALSYAADPAVEYAHPDYEFHATLLPNDPFLSSTGSWGQPFADLWGLQLTQAPAAWDTATGSGTVVAVIDTGIDFHHPDLAANIWTNHGEIPHNRTDDDGNGYIDDVHGWDFVRNKNQPTDFNGHGTHVAGTIAALGNNGIGIIGMAWHTQVMPLRGLDAKGSGFMSKLVLAILYAAQNGADVINCSWGGLSPELVVGEPSALGDALATASSLGAVIIGSAGNDAVSVDGIAPAGYPQVIAVGATQHDDTVASFSNYGNALSVAAPGVDVLSLRSGINRLLRYGKKVDRRYLVLSGTSMAAPHVSGLSALLLSAQPTLKPEEVRWHLELNADQPGYPGYEGQPWNPHGGWGRINAARVFDPPPVTTRLRTHYIEHHAFVNTVEPRIAAADFTFTTLDPVPWTITTPPWFPATPNTGSGDARVGLSIDTTNLAVGDYSGTVSVVAPSATDGGASLPATLHAHSDHRVGGPILLDNTFQASGAIPFIPELASNGQQVLAVWFGGSTSPATVPAALVDSAGNVTGPFNVVSSFPSKPEAAAASDGQNFLVAWSEQYEAGLPVFPPTMTVKAVRVSATGQLLDANPLVLHTETYSVTNPNDILILTPLEAAFDGTAYTVMWGEFTGRIGHSVLYVCRVGTDGTPCTQPTAIYPVPTDPQPPEFIFPRIACANGSCLVAWVYRDGELSQFNTYIDKVYGIRLAGTRVLDPVPFRIATDAYAMTAIASDGSNYGVLSGRLIICAGPIICGSLVLVTRVTGTGTVLDPAGIQVNNSAPQSKSGIIPERLAFDGTNYVALFAGEIVDGSTDIGGWLDLGTGGPEREFQQFVTRVGLDGTVLDSEPEGLLVHAGNTYTRASIAAAQAGSIVVWADLQYSDPTNPWTWYNPVSAQRLLPRP